MRATIPGIGVLWAMLLVVDAAKPVPPPSGLTPGSPVGTPVYSENAHYQRLTVGHGRGGSTTSAIFPRGVPYQVDGPHPVDAAPGPRTRPPGTKTTVRIGETGLPMKQFMKRYQSLDATFGNQRTVLMHDGKTLNANAVAGEQGRVITYEHKWRWGFGKEPRSADKCKGSGGRFWTACFSG